MLYNYEVANEYDDKKPERQAMWISGSYELQ